MADAQARRNGVLTVSVVGVFVILTAATLWAGRIVFIPIAFAILLSYAVQPLERLVARSGVPHPLAAAIVMTALLTGVGGAIYGVRGQVATFVAAVPDAFHRVSDLLHGPANGQWTALSRIQQAAREIEKASANAAQAPPAPRGVTRVQVENPPLSFTDLMWRSTDSAITFAGQVLVVIVLMFYFLSEDDLFKRKLVKIAETYSEKRLTVEILNDIEHHIGRYLAARLLISVIVAVATAVAFWALDMPQPAVWGVIAGVLNVVPYIGPITVTLAAAITAFLHSGSAGHAFWVGATETGIGVLEGFVLTPTLMGRAGRMNGAAVFISLTIWGFLWGPWGLLLAVPLTMAFKVLCDRVDALSPMAELLGE